MTRVTLDLDELRQEIAAREAELETLRSVERYIRSQLRETEETVTPSAIQDSERFKALFAHDAAEIVLRERGEPMKTSEIVEALQAGGYGENLSNIRNAVYTALDRKKETFRRDAPGTWALAEWEDRQE